MNVHASVAADGTKLRLMFPAGGKTHIVEDNQMNDIVGRLLHDGLGIIFSFASNRTLVRCSVRVTLMTLGEKVPSIDAQSEKRTVTRPRQVAYYLSISSTWIHGIQIIAQSKHLEEMRKHLEGKEIKNRFPLFLSLIRANTRHIWGAERNDDPSDLESSKDVEGC
jgi:hypothetical protein